MVAHGYMPMTERMDSPLFVDGLTTLPNITGWISSHPGGLLAVEGCLVGLHAAELELAGQRYDRDVADELFLALVRRVQQVIRTDDCLLRGHGYTLIAWLPGSAAAGEAFTERVYGVLETEPVTWPDGGTLLAPPVIVAQPVAAGDEAEAAVQAVTVTLARTRAAVAMSVGAETPLALLNARLDAVRLFAREPLLESLLAHLHLPERRPETVLLTGSPDSGKSRLLTCAARYLEGQAPLAEVTCRPGDRLVPCALLVSLLTRFFNASPPQVLRERLAGVSAQYPWLGSLFSLLSHGDTPPPPAETAALRRGIEALLHVMVGAGPHLAVVHDLSTADAESLAVLARLQQTPGHGLRVIAGVDVAETEAAAMRDWMPPDAVSVPVEPLGPAQVDAYLTEVLPEVAGPEVAEALYRAAGGQSLAMEATLRGWVDGEVLRRTAEGWVFDAAALRAQTELGLGARERERLAIAALLGEGTVDQLAVLWETTVEEARATVLRGRAFGFLLPMNSVRPGVVAFSSPDDAAGLVRTLSPAARTAAHARIAALLEGAGERTSPALAYHLTEAGESDRATLYLELVQAALPALLAMANMAAAGAPGVPASSWDVPPPGPVSLADTSRIITAALAIRLAGVRFRLYPENSEMVQQAVHDAYMALQALLQDRPSFIIAWDGRLVTFDGQLLHRREEQIISRDMQQWLTDAGLEALAFLPGVSEHELTCLLRALGTYEPSDGQQALRDALHSPELVQIRLLEQQGRHPAAGGGPATGWAASGAAQAAPLAATLAPLAARAAALPPAQSPATAGTASVPVAWYNTPLQFDADTWSRLPDMLGEATGAIRRVMMTDLSRWLAKQDPAAADAVPDDLDPLLHSRIACEEDPRALAETLCAAEQRVQLLIKREQLDDVVALLSVLHTRCREEADPEVQSVLAAAWERLRDDADLSALAERALLAGGRPEQLGRLLTLLGDRGVGLIIAVLLQPLASQAGAQVMTVVRQLGGVLSPRLTRELRIAHPVPVLTNVLQALAEVGARSSLGAVSEKMLHEDAAVRAAALDAATRIARDKASPYLARGLKDASPEVRARAASLVVLCPDPVLLAPLVRLLTAGGFAAEENEHVQLAGCLALGCYRDAAARDALLQVLRPRLFPALRRRSDQVRGAAITALAGFLAQPVVQEAVQHAMQDRSPIVGQTARRVWLKFTEDTPNNA